METVGSGASQWNYHSLGGDGALCRTAQCAKGPREAAGHVQLHPAPGSC